VNFALTERAIANCRRGATAPDFSATTLQSFNLYSAPIGPIG
jgi:hypothetical protein